MNLRIPHLFPNIRNKNHNLLMCHTQALSKQKRTNTLQIPLNIRQRPEANFFILGILGPSIAGPLKRFPSDVEEACFFHTTLVVFLPDEWTAECCGSFDG